MNAPNPLAYPPLAYPASASGPLAVQDPAPQRAQRQPRSAAGDAAAPHAVADRIDGWWSLLYHGWTLMAPGGARIDLTAMERACLLCLLRNPKRELSRGEWLAMREKASMRTLNVAICRLRHKVLQTGTRLPLHTVHGVGYVFLGNLREDSNC